MAIMLALASIPSWGAQPQGEAGAAPVPPPIVSAKRVFISNAGGGCSPFGKAGFSGGPNRPYNQFNAALKGWGRYELVAAPADADLAFEISFTCPAAGMNVANGHSIGPTYDPQLRLVILDVKTHITLWGITEHVELANPQSKRDKNFDRAMQQLMNDLKSLAAGSPPPSVGVATGL
jgi:hypothetical protein